MIGGRDSSSSEMGMELMDSVDDEDEESRLARGFTEAVAIVFYFVFFD
jgi:hypothetical protein